MKYWSDYILPQIRWWLLAKPLYWLAERFCHHPIAHSAAGRCLIAHGYSGYRHCARVGNEMWEIKVDSRPCRTRAQIEAEMQAQ